MLRGRLQARTSPYAFQGCGEGAKMVLNASRETGMPVVTDHDFSQLPYFDDVDVIQVGAGTCRT